MKKIVLVITLLFSGVSAQEEYKALYLGILGEESIPFHKEFERKIGDQIAVINGIEKIDPVDVDMVKQRSHIGKNFLVSDNLLKNIRDVTKSNVIVIAVKVEKFSIYPKRRFLVLSKVKGVAHITLYMYDTKERRYLYMGDIAAETEIMKGHAVHSDMNKNTHVSSQDKIAVAEQLIQTCIDKSSDIIKSIVQTKVFKKEVSIVNDENN